MLQKYLDHFLSPIVYFGDPFNTEDDEMDRVFSFDSKSQFPPNIGLFLNWQEIECDGNFSDLSQRE